MISRAHRNVLILLDLTDSHIGFIRQVYVNRPRNKTVMDLTASAVNRLHRHFDRDMSKWVDYCEAKKIADGFYEKVAA
jgi:hypothetical protein